MTELSPRRVWLIGSMGSGKTVVGRALEQQLGWPLLDNDLELEASEGRSLTDLAEDGPEALHRREAAQLHRAAATPPPFVAGVAASVGDRPADLDLLGRTGSVVYLRATVETLAARLGRGEGRPWLDDDPVSWLAASLAQREPAYLAVADVVVDVDQGTPDDVARAVVEGLLARDADGPAGPEAHHRVDGEESG